MKKIFLIFIFLFNIFYTSTHLANEVEIYADSIDYDADGNIVAKGNVKIIDGENILTSSIIFVNQEQDKITLPKDFQYKDDKNNYYYGSSGEFTINFENAEVNDLKMLLEDGSRIVGKKGIKTGDQDLIYKGVFSPCKSKINIKDFVCPIWQVEGEKILHDREKLFLHTKHAKMRLFNAPVYYFPYIISPSPLRKKRKSGFLNPQIAFNFLDTKISQSISTPYYVAISQDKELLLTPTINYGGGVDASQRVTYNYNQITSGGKLKINASTDTNLENENNESWLRDASIILELNENINENYNMNFSSALQTSPTYLRRTDQNNPINRKSSLNTTFNLNGYEILESNDNLSFTISGYQVVRNNEDNKTSPTSLPYIKYNSGIHKFRGNNYKNHFTFYNIFRETVTDEHAKEQQKLEHVLVSNNNFNSFYSNLTFKAELYTQLYNVENKENNTEVFNGTYTRVFPMTGLYFETPLVNKKNNIYITPKIFGVFNSSQSNSNKISNEESTDYQYTLLNFNDLSRYTGTDKLENSKRISYGIDIIKDNFKAELGQSYEFDKERNEYTSKVGLNDYMSDILGSAKFDGESNNLLYNFRFNTDQGLMKFHNITHENQSFLGNTNISYSKERKEVNSILETGTETVGLSFGSKEFLKYSKISLSSSFDLIEEDPTNYKFGYQYIDECFAINLDFERSFYDDRDLKPKDILTLMFSFKHLGSYKSSNLAVSELDKQDISWDSGSIDDKQFK
tara:strand:+ start:1135 stop:3357 length:2223 start_codon:yes stop_codon:yes gene_type:complete